MVFDVAEPQVGAVATVVVGRGVTVGDQRPDARRQQRAQSDPAGPELAALRRYDAEVVADQPLSGIPVRAHSYEAVVHLGHEDAVRRDACRQIPEQLSGRRHEPVLEGDGQPQQRRQVAEPGLPDGRLVYCPVGQVAGRQLGGPDHHESAAGGGQPAGALADIADQLRRPVNRPAPARQGPARERVVHLRSAGIRAGEHEHPASPAEELIPTFDVQDRSGGVDMTQQPTPVRAEGTRAIQADDRPCRGGEQFTEHGEGPAALHPLDHDRHVARVSRPAAPDAKRHASVDLAGVPTVADPQLMSIMGMRPHAVAGGSPALVVRRVAGSAATAPIGATFLDAAGVRCTRAAGTVTVFADDRSLTASVSPGRVDVRGDVDGRLARAVLTYALAFALAEFDVTVLHAAAVRRQEFTLLVLAPSGGGKTTTAVAAHRHGWQVLSDDWVAARRDESGAILASGLPRRWAVPREIAAPGTVPLPGDPRGRHIEEVACIPGSYRVDGIVILEHGERTTLAAAEGERLTFRHVLDASYTVADPLLVRAVMPLAARLATLPSWRVRAAADPAARLIGLAQVLTRISERGLAVTEGAGVTNEIPTSRARSGRHGYDQDTTTR